MTGQIVAIPKEYRKEIVREILKALRESTGYPHQMYILSRKVARYIHEKPEEYPILSKKKKPTVVRMVSAYLQEKGRVLRNPNAHGHSCWMLATGKEGAGL